MQKFEKKRICLLMNLGGFEHRLGENLEMSSRYGEAVYSLALDGLADPSNALPANVMAMTRDELLSWSDMVSRQVKERGWDARDVVILAAGRNHRGILPLGTVIAGNIRLGA